MSVSSPSKRSAQRCAPVSSIDELPRYTHSIARLPHAAFKHVADAEIAPDLLHVHSTAFVREARIAGDHE